MFSLELVHTRKEKPIYSTIHQYTLYLNLLLQNLTNCLFPSTHILPRRFKWRNSFF
jgi:hypothetical protein